MIFSCSFSSFVSLKLKVMEGEMQLAFIIIYLFRKILFICFCTANLLFQRSKLFIKPDVITKVTGLV